jgi:hypothetical protein
VSRERLPDRRPSVTLKVPIVWGGNFNIKLLVTIGFTDRTFTRPLEVFCADFKAGTDIHPIIMDACILVSRLLQHGDTPAGLLASMSGNKDQAHSLVGSIIKAIAEFKP